jgi:hypothetical protein
MYKKFEAVSFGSDKFGSLIRMKALPYGGNTSPIEATLNALGKAPLGCKTAVFESDYVDKDYQDEFSAYYSKSFKVYGTRCTRVHFFSRAFPKKNALDFANYPTDSYLGFIILRPTDLQRMGRTILKPTVTEPDCEFITCQTEYCANVLGIPFKIKGMPFMQQDTQVGACAQASLWMLARYMSRRFNYREYLPAEINQFAKSHSALGRQLPAEKGLTVAQMLDALQGMGFSAISYVKEFMDDYSEHLNSIFPFPKNCKTKREEKLRNLNRTAKLADIAYRYIESGLPVIITTPGHAIVGIGHSYDFDKFAKQAIQRIPSFIVHNDAVGPYLTMPILSKDPHLTSNSFLEADGIIVVTPNEATLCGEDAEDLARGVLNEVLDEKSRTLKGKQFKDDLIAMRQDFRSLFRNFEYRTYLMSSVEFQRDLRRDIEAGGLARKVGLRLLRLDYPKFVWITEVSCAALLRHQNKKERKCLGRIIVDSTAPRKTNGVIALHFADAFVVYDRQNKAKDYWSIELNSTPIVHKFMTDDGR